jgi:hypothetical protein
MELLFDAAIAVGLLALLVVVIYLADKVRSLETRAAPAPAPASPTLHTLLDPLEGLSGKALWEHLTKASAQNPAPSAMLAFYAEAFNRHVHALVDDGQRDARRGTKTQVTPKRTLTVYGRELESWLPSGDSQAIYDWAYAQAGGGDGLISVPEASASAYTTVHELCRKLNIPAPSIEGLEPESNDGANPVNAA